MSIVTALQELLDMGLSIYNVPAIVAKIKALESANEKLTMALEMYADEEYWSCEAWFDYETGNYLPTGDPEWKEESVELDGDIVWHGYGEHGYELAQETLKEVEGQNDSHYQTM